MPEFDDDDAENDADNDEENNDNADSHEDATSYRNYIVKTFFKRFFFLRTIYNF